MVVFWMANNSRCLRKWVNKRRAVELIAITCMSLIWMGCGGSSSSARSLLSISVEPANAQATAPTGTSPFTASGTFDQPPTTDDNLTAQWSSSDATIATIDGNTGVAMCIAAGGPITITASSGQKRGTAQLTCVAAPQAGSGNCTFICGSVRCGALTGYCAISTGNACRQVFDPGECPQGRPAGAPAADTCGVSVDSSRACGE